MLLDLDRVERLRPREVIRWGTTLTTVTQAAPASSAVRSSARRAASEPSYPTTIVRGRPPATAPILAARRDGRTPAGFADTRRRNRPCMATLWRSGVLASDWLDLDGVRFHARTAPRAGAPAVVLVHGIGVSSRYMVPLAEALATFASVHALDLPGFGRSTKPRRTLTTSELGRALSAWLERAGVETPVVVGNSFGCQVAVELAVREPARLRGVVLVGPTVDPAARNAARQIARWVASGLVERPSLLLVLGRDYLDAGPARIWRTFEESLGDPIAEKLRRVAVPALVVRGSRDPIVPARWAERAAALLPRGRLAVVPGGGHALNYSRPRDLARLVRAFVSELDDSADGR